MTQPEYRQNFNYDLESKIILGTIFYKTYPLITISISIEIMLLNLNIYPLKYMLIGSTKLIGNKLFVYRNRKFYLFMIIITTR